MSLESYAWMIIILFFGFLGFFLEKFHNYAFYVCLLFGVIVAGSTVYLID